MYTFQNVENPLLLSREQFNKQVFERSQQLCVVCNEPAVDAHHVLERKLFCDGGYYLHNGVAVCAACHLLCEYTTIGVEQLRVAAGITNTVVPAGWDVSLSYDKWGNTVWPSGLRSAGPLEHDTGMRRALAAGGFLGILMPSDYVE